MKAPHTSPIRASLNQLRRGATYNARTDRAQVRGEYLGMERPYGEFAILLRNEDVTESVPVSDLVSIEAA